MTTNLRYYFKIMLYSKGNQSTTIVQIEIISVLESLSYQYYFPKYMMRMPVVTILSTFLTISGQEPPIPPQPQNQPVSSKFPFRVVLSLYAPSMSRSALSGSCTRGCTWGPNCEKSVFNLGTKLQINSCGWVNLGCFVD